MTPSVGYLDELPVAAFLTDADGRVTYFNKAAEEFRGAAPQIGATAWAGAWRLLRPDGRAMAESEYPMAIARRTKRAVRDVEAIVAHDDGRHYVVLAMATPLFDAQGIFTGGINLLVDITERDLAHTDAAQLAAIVESSDDAIISKTLDGIIRSWNASATRIFGHEAGDIIGQHITRIIPPELREEETRIVAQLSKGEHIQHFETKRMTKDGRLIDVSLSVSPVRDKAGRIVGASKVARDVTERKRAEQRQKLLIQELNHRVKNTLATVQAIANQSLAQGRSVQEFAAAFSGRLQALARAHTLLTDHVFEGADLGDLVRDQVLFSTTGDDPRIGIAGPPVTLNVQTTTNLALILHELGTNARKYGALARPEGRLSVVWTIQNGATARLTLTWTESNLSGIKAPTATGFGTTLLTQTAEALGGEIRTHYSSSGLTCTIILPLPADMISEVQVLGAQARIAAAQKPEQQLDLTGLRVLIVEDEPILAMDVEATLERAGCAVVGPASSVDSAMKAIAGGDYDIALLDANLRGKSVEALAGALAERRVPFAFVSGYGRDALPAGFRDRLLLAKPFLPQQIVATARTLANQRAA